MHQNLIDFQNIQSAGRKLLIECVASQAI